MELFPALQISWLNGWLLLAFEFLIQGGLLLLLPKDVVTWLFDRSGWRVKQRLFTILGKLFSLVCLVLIILTPLKFNLGSLIPGLVLYAIGIAGLVIAMLNFRDTPPDQPVTKGVYRFSRHPQIVSLFIIFLGICLAIGSWAALIALLLSRMFRIFVSWVRKRSVCISMAMLTGITYRKSLAFFCFSRLES